MYGLKRSGDAIIKGADWLLGTLTGLPASVITWATDTVDKSQMMGGWVAQNAITNAVGNAMTLTAGYLVPFSTT